MRPKSTGRHLPPCMLCRINRFKSGKIWASYYCNGCDENGGRKEFPLRNDLNEAKRKWAEHDCAPVPVETGLMEVVLKRYVKEVLRPKALSTQKDNLGSLKQLRSVLHGKSLKTLTRTPSTVAFMQLSGFSAKHKDIFFEFYDLKE